MYILHNATAVLPLQPSISYPERDQTSIFYQAFSGRSGNTNLVVRALWLQGISIFYSHLTRLLNLVSGERLKKVFCSRKKTLLFLQNLRVRYYSQLASGFSIRKKARLHSKKTWRTNCVPFPWNCLLLWPQSSTYSLKDERNWRKQCISQRNHSSRSNTFKILLSQRICRRTDLLDFEEWGFMPLSVLLQTFPVDQETKNYVRRVQSAVFSTVRPVPLKYKPHLVAVSSEVLTEILDLKTPGAESEDFVQFVAGNNILPNSVLLSHRYGGHQVSLKSFIVVMRRSIRAFNTPTPLSLAYPGHLTMYRA